MVIGVKVKSQECKNFEKCSAPLCPLDGKSLEHGIWYPDEEICISQQFSSSQFIRNQKKVKKKTKDEDTYYTYKMLNRKFVIGSAITGLDPDKEKKPQLRKWFEAHPEMRELSEEEKQKMRERMIRIRERYLPERRGSGEAEKNVRENMVKKSS